MDDRQVSFAAGELSPAFYSRTDLAKYAIGLRTCRNFLIKREGGAQYRPGTEFVQAVKDSTNPARLIKFVFDVSDTLMLEFGDRYVRFYQNGAPVVVTPLGAWSNALVYTVGEAVTFNGVTYTCRTATGTIWNSTTAYNVGDLANLSTGPFAGTTFLCVTPNTNQQPPSIYWQLVPFGVDVSPDNPVYWSPLTGDVYEIVTPYAVADVGTINVVQSADVLTLVHPNYPPATLSRLSDTSWVYAPISFSPTVAAPTLISVQGTIGAGHVWQYGVTAVSDATGEESFVDAGPQYYFFVDPTETAPHSITWHPVPGATTYNIYVGLDFGVLGFLGTATTQYVAASYKNTGLTQPDFTTQPPQPFTDFTGAGNYPSVVGYYQQRLVFANTRNNPARVWCSRSGNYHNFTKSTPITDDGPIVFTMVSDEIDAIQHVLNLGKLIIGTRGAEWLVDGDANGVLTPAQVNDRIGSYNGSSALKPVKVDNTILYVQSLGGKVLELKTNILYGYYTFQGADVTLMSSHLFTGLSLVDWDFQQQPNYTIWAVRSDGVLLSLTYLPDQQLVAWAHHDTQGFVENVCVVPEAVSDVPYLSDAVYLIVRRVINGVTQRYVERMRPIDLIDETNDPVFMDCAQEYDGRNAGAPLGITMTLTNT